MKWVVCLIVLLGCNDETRPKPADSVQTAPEATAGDTPAAAGKVVELTNADPPFSIKLRPGAGVAVEVELVPRHKPNDVFKSYHRALLTANNRSVEVSFKGLKDANRLAAARTTHKARTKYLFEDQRADGAWVTVESVGGAVGCSVRGLIPKANLVARGAVKCADARALAASFMTIETTGMAPLPLDGPEHAFPKLEPKDAQAAGYKLAKAIIEDNRETFVGLLPDAGLQLMGKKTSVAAVKSKLVGDGSVKKLVGWPFPPPKVAGPNDTDYQFNAAEEDGRVTIYLSNSASSPDPGSPFADHEDSFLDLILAKAADGTWQLVAIAVPDSND